MISIIAALAANRVIGRSNDLPWRLPADLRHFRQLTTGHAVILGRRNHESIGKPLPNRTNIVVTRQPDYAAPGCLIAHSLADALAMAGNDPEIFIIGGAEIYAQALPLADKLYLTRVEAEVPGDTFFPEFDIANWQETASASHPADADHAYAFRFVTLERRTK